MRLQLSYLSLCAALSTTLSTRGAHAQPAGESGAASATASSAPAATATADSLPALSAPADETLTPRSGVPVADDDGLGPRGNLWELGLFGGLLFVSDRNALHEARKPFADFKQPAPEVGLRLAYLPLSFLGLEIEAMGAAGQLKGGGGTRDGEGAVVWAGRGHLLLQIPTRSVTPFALVGAGRLGIISDSAGKDNDPELHFGGGVKINLARRVALRLEGRDTITKQRPEAGTAHTIEALAGFSLVFGRPAARPKDSDGDGIADLQDLCPLEAGVPPDGCPIRDTDGDGIPDLKDQCPSESGIAPTGCPVRDSDGDGVPDASDECREVAGIPPTGCPDTDGDGVLDRDDKCIDVRGVAPDGCPGDSDGDGIPDDKDRCPKEPETKNGFQDEDGCPDEVPAAVKRFTGVIKGIEFELNKADVKIDSRPVLDQAAGILNQYPSLKVMIVGHTDNQGNREKNIELSRQRAESVRQYIISRGVEGSRIETRGEGPDSPIADNKTKTGRAQNRRIEFQMIK